MLPPFHLLILLILPLLPFTTAQFQFFEQMFNRGGEPQQQRQQNVASDSRWYQETYENGYFFCPPSSLTSACSNITPNNSTLHKLPLPRHPRMRALPPPLPLRLASRGR